MHLKPAWRRGGGQQTRKYGKSFPSLLNPNKLKCCQPIRWEDTRVSTCFSRPDGFDHPAAQRTDQS